MTVRDDVDNPLGCPAVSTLALFSGKWKPMVLHLLADESLHFGELRRRLDPITPKVLTQQLRELEADALVTRTVHDGTVVTVTYALSKFGESVAMVIEILYAWGEKNLPVEQGSGSGVAPRR